MASDDLASLLAGRAASLIADRSLSPVDLLDSCLARIAARDAEIHAWVRVDEAGARAAARERHAEARAGRLRGPLHGVPVGVKDIIHVAGQTTTCGAAPAFHVVASEDATAVARLRAAGAIILGKAHTTEFAYFEPGPTRNPWNTAHTPGGSSSGSAAAVAARMAPLALGTQTVGSVLRPAAYCGVVGFKGTHGLISTEGVGPLAWSLAPVGVYARAVGDVALTAAVLSGRPLAGGAPRPPRLALAPELVDRATPETAAEVRAAAARLARAGAIIEEVKLPASFAGVHAAGRVLEVRRRLSRGSTDRRRVSAAHPQVIAGGLAGPVAYARLPLPFREDHAAAHDPDAAGPHRAGPRAGGARDGRSVVLRAVELRRRARVLAAERRVRARAPARGAARRGSGARHGAARGGHVVRARARLQALVISNRSSDGTGAVEGRLISQWQTPVPGSR
jgi:aspartyl-tRNA(Asn)/glutamyl-tRNA(Gln) amidotransferase subunit A